MTFEIVLYPFPMRKVDYPRPCVIIERKSFELLSVSTKAYAKFNYFTIHTHHPNFLATGLKETSFVIGEPIIRGSTGRIISHIGELQGELAEEFAEWIGA